MSLVAFELNAHSAIIEYPGYGVYKKETSSEKTICEDALLLYDYMTSKVGFHPDNIILVGRSMGSGPSTYLATQRKVKLLALVSAYKSIKSVAKDHYPFWGSFIKERFNNLERIKQMNQPLFLVHGLQVTSIG